MKKRPKRRLKATKARQLLAPTQHSYPAHFKQNQNNKIAPDPASNALGRNTGKLREVERYLSLRKQAIAEETQRFVIRRNANIQFFLVICVAIAFFAYYSFSLYELFSKGDVRWIVGDVPAVRYFWKMVDHFVFRK
ncbi:MAG: hypothetical protein ACRDIV_27450 [Ktedonobacteraceae bacterium]